MNEKHYIIEFSNLYKEWDFEKNNSLNIFPDSFVIGSAKKVWWKCSECGNSWIASIRSRTVRGTGCPKCALKQRGISRRKSSVLKNGSISNEKLLLEWNYEKNDDLPKDFSPSSNKKVWWKCSKCGYEWETKIANRKNGRNCPCCSNKIVVVGVNDLTTTNSDLSKEWHPTKNGNLKPTDVTIGTGRKVWWICPLGHEYQASVMHRGHGTGCPVCNSGRQTSFSEQAVFFYIKKVFPDAINRYKFDSNERFEVDIYIPSINLAIEYDGEFWHESEKARNTDARKYSLLSKNGIRLWRIREDFSQSEILVTQSFSGKAVDFSDIKAEYIFYYNPGNKYKNLDFLIKNVLYLVNPNTNPLYARVFTTKIHHLNVDTKRDMFKINQYILPLKKSFVDEFANIAEEWHPTKNAHLTPNMFSKGSDFKAWWKCKKCGYEWQASIGHRTRGSGCPMCYQEKSRKNHYKSKKIIQYSLDGKLIKEWESISSASRELKINHSNISMCAKQQRQKAGGFKWKFASDD